MFSDTLRPQHLCNVCAYLALLVLRYVKAYVHLYRRTRALSPARGPVQRMASAWLEGATRDPDGPVQRMAPSWLEGATRDSDPPDPTARRHRLAFSSRNNAYLLQQQQLQQQQQQQQTLPQAYDRWEMHAAPLPQGQDLSMDDPHLQAMQPVLVQPRRQQAQMQHPVASSSHR